MDAEQVNSWAAENPLSPLDVDCTTALMLQILDGSCALLPQEKRVIALLYDAVKQSRGKLLDSHIHAMIYNARYFRDNYMREHIRNATKRSERLIPPTSLKHFIARIRNSGLVQLPEVSNNVVPFRKVRTA